MSIFKTRLIKYSGFIHGFKYPSIELVFEQAFTDVKKLEGVRLSCISCLVRFDDNSEAHRQKNIAEQTAYFFIDLIKSLHDEVGLEVFETSLVQLKDEENFQNLRLVMPIHNRALNIIFQYLCDITTILSKKNINQSNFVKKLTQRCVLQLKQVALKSSNTPRFVRAAHQMSIPLYYLPGELIQYGQGFRSRRMNSSFTDQTSQIAAALARSKPMTASILRSSGLPVPRHFLVRSAEAAIVAAKKLGFPVVVKPSDMDGGLGVTALIESDSEVITAYQSASQYSKNILVEEYVIGKDYRLVVMGGELIWAIERVPGGVTGDGKSSIKELVSQVNADPLRSKLPNAPLKPIIWDDELESCLKYINMTSTTVPSYGQFVQLRRAANIALGGKPVGVFDQVHPDNQDLAIRATEALRLDLAGVDLLIPDISTSWLETGAAICEVNAQPNIGYTTTTHLYAQILASLVQYRGRIPIIFYVDIAGSESDFFDGLLEGLLPNITLGIYDCGNTYVNDRKLSASTMNLMMGVQALILNKLVQAIVIKIEDATELELGLPVCRYDLLIINNSEFVPSNKKIKSQKKYSLDKILQKILPGCDGYCYNLYKINSKNLEIRFDVQIKNFTNSKKMLIESIRFILSYVKND